MSIIQETLMLAKVVSMAMGIMFALIGLVVLAVALIEWMIEKTEV